VDTDPHWRSHWARRRSPGHRAESDEFYRDYAAELHMLFGDGAPQQVLEIGCGNGALFPFLGFDRAQRYVGVDFSRSMLESFGSAHPRTELVAADGAAYRSDDRFDLIFSSQVAQYWTRTQLAGHLENSAEMVAHTGRIVVSGIPWSRMRLAYSRGDLTGGPRRSMPVMLLAAGHEWLRAGLGNWFDYPDLKRLADPLGLRVKFFGSAHYPYRFHAVLSRYSDALC
jgi:SAM-dependent methyltransferase